MIGKLIAWGKDRDEAISRVERALNELIITGINTNIDFHTEILKNDKFLENKIDTSFIEKEMMR